MNESNARVAAILPFYRAGKFITQAIESVLHQVDYADWHLYLINDGSDDIDVQIARQFCSRHSSSMTLLEHYGGGRRGISASRNLAIERTHAEFIAFLDADDTWHPHKLASQVSSLDNCPGADMIYGPAVRWSSWNGGVDAYVPATVDGFGSDCVVPGAALLATFLRDEALTPCIGSVIIRRAAVLNVGGFEEQFRGVYDDQVLYAKLAAASRIIVSSECVSCYRQHPESCCRQVESADTGDEERSRFLAWLRSYQERERNQTSKFALPSRESVDA